MLVPGPEAKELITSSRREARQTTPQCEGGRTSSREKLGASEPARSCCLFAFLFYILLSDRSYCYTSGKLCSKPDTRLLLSWPFDKAAFKD